MQNCTSVDESLCSALGLETPAFVAQLLPQLVDLVRASHQLPVGEEHAIRRGSREFVQATKELSGQTLSMAHRVLKFLDPSTHGGHRAEELANYSTFADSIDNILERVDVCLQEALAGTARRDGAAAAATESRTAASVVSAAEAVDRGPPKPQARWRQLVDNERTCFVPRLVEKHHAQVPMQPEIIEAQRRAGLRGMADAAPASAAAAVLGIERALPHPYATELQDHCWSVDGFESVVPRRYERMEDTPLIFVSTAEQLREMIEEIKATCTGGEIAVDVEHHHDRSYRGFVCLVQISTRQKDFVIDPFDIFEQMCLLNEIFSDPSIVKVLHGADRDVIWLQRDFSVYLVNMFDTGAATRVLKLQGGFSLANLVSFYCGMKLDKKYQTADWRQRPLSDEMVQYARCDTHYLLYCYDRLRNALLSAGSSAGSLAAADGAKPEVTESGIQALQAVLERSTELCRQLYTEAPFEEADAARKLCERFGSKHRPLEARNFAALKALVTWRDRLSRSLDESCNFVAPDACFWRIAFSLPATASRLRSTCNPLPSALLEHAQELVDLLGRLPDGAAQPSGTPAAATVGDGSVGRAAPLHGGSRGALELTAPLPAPVVAAIVAALPAWRDWPVRRRGMEPVVHVAAAADAAGAVRLRRLAVGGGSLLAVLPVAESSEDEDGGAVLVGTGPAAASSAPEARRRRQQLQSIAGAMTFTAVAPEKTSSIIKEILVQPSAGASSALLAALGETPAVAGSVAEELFEPQVRRKKRKRAADGRTCLESVVKAAVSAQVASAATGTSAAALEPQAPAAPSKKKRRPARQALELPAAASDPYL